MGCTGTSFNEGELAIVDGVEEDAHAVTVVGSGVVMEAERFNHHAPTSRASWVVDTTVSGFAGTGAMRASPDRGDLVAIGGGPRLDYDVSLPGSGARYVWVRAYASATNDDSLHVGVNGNAAVSPWYWGGTLGQWTWQRKPIASLPAGAVKVNVWMREDGFRIDKILLTSDGSYVPSGLGPSDVASASDAGMVATDAGNTAVDGGTVAADGGTIATDAGPPAQDSGSSSTSCGTAPGAQTGATTRGSTTYDGSGTTTVRNVIFDGSHSDDLVRVYNGHVIFENVTFRGRGTGSSGHTLEVKRGGSVEVRNSRFEGAPSEDHIQFEANDSSVVFCNVFTTRPGEDHLDTKPGASVRIERNDFGGGGHTLQNHNGTGRIELIGNTNVDGVFYESGATGSIVGNRIASLRMYDCRDVLVEGNVIANVKHGEGTTTRDPVDAYFLNNSIADAQNNGGTCFRTGNTGAEPVAFCRDGAPAWYP